MAQNDLFFEFAYILRKKDPSNIYTKRFLSRIKPQILYDIVISNVWSNELNQFIIDPSETFKMTIGNDILQRNTTNLNFSNEPSNCNFSDDIQFSLCHKGIKIRQGEKILLT
jgi:hypothetical protein